MKKSFITLGPCCTYEFHLHFGWLVERSHSEIKLSLFDIYREMKFVGGARFNEEQSPS